MPLSLKTRKGGAPLPLEQLQLKRELLDDYRDLLPAMAPDEQRRIRGEQDIIVQYEPARALETLPSLLAKPDERKRVLKLFDRLLRDERFMGGAKPTDGQLAMHDPPAALPREAEANMELDALAAFSAKVQQEHAGGQ